MATLTEYITRDLISISPSTPIADVVALFIEHNISGAPVLDDNGSLVGILTAKDCFRAALHASYYQGWTHTAVDVMTTEVRTLDANLDLISAAERFLETNFRRFPIVKEGRLVGIMTRLDLLRALHEQQS